MTSTTTTENIPTLVRSQLADTLEDIGSAMALLREAATDEVNNNPQGARIVASDALELLSNLETRFSEMAAQLAKYSEN